MAETKSLSSTDRRTGFWGYWTLLPEGIWFASQNADVLPSVEYFDFATRRTTTVGQLDAPAYPRFPFFVVSPDGRSIFLCEARVSEVGHHPREELPLSAGGSGDAAFAEAGRCRALMAAALGSGTNPAVALALGTRKLPTSQPPPPRGTPMPTAAREGCKRRTDVLM
jgi:hypothetical protein